MSNDKLLRIIEYGVKHKYFNKQKYILGLFSFIAEDDYEDEFFIIKDKKFYLKIEDGEPYLLDTDYKDDLLNFKDKVNLPAGYLVNNSKDIETTIGRVVMNYVLLARNFGNKIPYINESFTVGYIEDNYIATLLTDDENDLEKITVKEYIQFMDAVLYISGWSKFLSVAGTKKSVLPPDGIEEYKKKVVAELEKKYGKDKMNTAKVTAELEEKLSKYDEEWLKGDVSNGRLMYGKTKLARKKLFLNFGTSNTFGGKEDGVVNSLGEGWGTDPEQLTTLFNDARSGSFYRGAETQNGGVASKVLLRASSDIDIVDKDCSTKTGAMKKISDSDIGRQKMVGNKWVTITDKDVGITTIVRSPMYCKLKKDFCLECMGENMKGHTKGVSLMSIETGGSMLAMSLSKFHASALQLTNVSISDFK